MARRSRRRFRRIIIVGAFYASLLLLLGSLLSTYLRPIPSQLSAYGDDWDDLSEFREELNDLGIPTKSLVSSPLLLEDVDDPSHTVVIIAGLERDAVDIPSFGSTGISTSSLSGGQGYSTSEINAIIGFVARGGSVLVMEDYGFASSLGVAFGVDYSGQRLFDEEWAHELDSNFTWMNLTENISGTDGLVGHERWHGSHPCVKWSNVSVTSAEDAGLCRHRWNSTTNEIEYNAEFHILLNTPSGFLPTEPTAALTMEPIGQSSQESYLDVNGDGQLVLESELPGQVVDKQGPFDLYIEGCDGNCSQPNAGRIFFLINAIYGQNSGKYGGQIPVNDNRIWALDFIAESLLVVGRNISQLDVGSAHLDVLAVPEGAQVIFEESRHAQPAPLGLADSYNFIYYLMVYFTSDKTAMLLLFLALFVALEAVMIRKRDPEDWRHVFSVIYYGFGDSHRYGYYAKTPKIRATFLSKVRNNNGLTRDEFDLLPARDLATMIEDPILTKFVFEDRDYSIEQTVAIVKRIKAWGKT